MSYEEKSQIGIGSAPSVAMFRSYLNRRFTLLLIAACSIPFILFSLASTKDTTTSTVSHSPPPPQSQPTAAKKPSSSSSWHPFSSSSGDNSVARDVHNETLGFGEIVMISLPSRTDRQDAVSLIGSTTGVKITKLIPAVNGDSIDTKALPYGQAREKLGKKYLGSWRSHMDAFKYIVDNKIETALVIEDDIDWDIHLKNQLESFAKALRSSPLRAPLSEDERRRAPYGLDWDVLHLGTSKNQMAPSPHDNLFHKYTDTFATPLETLEFNHPCGEKDFYCWFDIIKKSKLEKEQRVIFPSYMPVGLVAIGVTYRGAQKMLYNFSWKDLDNSMDYSIRDKLKAGAMRGYTVTPPIFSSWSNGSPGDSDLRNDGKGPANPKNDGNSVGRSRGLAWSARKALRAVLEGGNYWKSDARWYDEVSAPPEVGLVGNEEGGEEGGKEIPEDLKKAAAQWDAEAASAGRSE